MREDASQPERAGAGDRRGVEPGEAGEREPALACPAVVEDEERADRVVAAAIW